jgi:hypothetical protein
MPGFRSILTLPAIIYLPRGLSQSDVEILGLEIMDSTKGELIEQQLDKISKSANRVIFFSSSSTAVSMSLFCGALRSGLLTMEAQQDKC